MIIFVPYFSLARQALSFLFPFYVGSRRVGLVLIEISLGECKLENMRTLCVACHSDVTKAQCAERRIARAKAKKQLKSVMNGLTDDPNNEQTCFDIKVCSRSTSISPCFLVTERGKLYFLI